MIFLQIIFILFLSFSVSAEAPVQKDVTLAMAKELYFKGKYKAAVDELKLSEQRLLQSSKENVAVLSLVNYWKGLCYNRLQDFQSSIRSFVTSLAYGQSPKDIHYELGQAFFAAEKHQEARSQFTLSFRQNFKPGVSLYYLGFSSMILGENQNAILFLESISKLKDPESEKVAQSAQILIGDIYLEDAIKSPNPNQLMKIQVIPQYEKALSLDRDSDLATVINKKIYQLQKDYRLYLFTLNNGRATVTPRYFIRLAQEIGVDSNVTFSPAETTISSAKQSSIYSRTDFIGRYTFYYKDYLGLTPELKFNNTYYFNRVPEIYRNDNYLIAPALRSSYEHSIWKKPASFLVDYDFSEARRNIDDAKNLSFSSRTHALMIGESFNFFNFGETVFRLRYRMLKSYLEDSDSQTSSIVFEQLVRLDQKMMLFFLSYDRTRVDSDVFNTDSMTFRTDLILPSFRTWFTPSFGLGFTVSDPYNDKENRGTEVLINPSARLARALGQKFRLNAKIDYQNNISKDKENFAFEKIVYGFELEYLF